MTHQTFITAFTAEYDSSRGCSFKTRTVCRMFRDRFLETLYVQHYKPGQVSARNIGFSIQNYSYCTLYANSGVRLIALNTFM